MGSGRGKARRAQYSSSVIGEMTDVDSLLEGDDPFDLAPFWTWKEKGMIGQMLAVKKSEHLASLLFVAFQQDPVGFWQKFTPALTALPAAKAEIGSLNLLYLLNWIARDDKETTRRTLEGMDPATLQVIRGKIDADHEHTKKNGGRCRYEALQGISETWEAREEQERLEGEASRRRRNITAALKESAGVVQF